MSNPVPTIPLTKDNHEHLYIEGDLGEECFHCGLLRSTIEGTGKVSEPDNVNSTSTNTRPTSTVSEPTTDKLALCPGCNTMKHPWNDKGECITCARDRVLGVSEPTKCRK